ncbi:MAG: putative Ig domain-containing protein [Anaerolineales bacterium]|nr:putative Ig domain-containing protein [Anaerolineales bacterium]
MTNVLRLHKPLVSILRLILILALCTAPFTAWHAAEAATNAPLALTPARLDTGFDPGSGADGAIDDIALAPDGFLYIVGSFTHVDGVSRNGVARINADGALETMMFSPGSGADLAVLAVAVQPDGKVIVGGSFTQFGGEARTYITRLSSLGDPDASFAAGASVSLDGTVQAIVLQPDGKIVIGGGFTHVGTASRNYIARLNADGTLDTSFDPGDGTNASVDTVVLQPDGKLLIGGYFTELDGAIKNHIARLNADGSRDTFTGSANDVVKTIALQEDGKIFIGGDFTSSGGSSRNRIARLNANGTLDSTFDPGSGANDMVYAIAVQEDGKVLLGGEFTTFRGVYRDHLVRLNEDGSEDYTYRYALYTGANNTVLAITLQPDGKAVLAGNFTDILSSGYARMARLHTDGSLDDGFAIGSGANDVIRGLEIQPDGKTLFWGDFTQFSIYSRNRIARLHLDGAMDGNFNNTGGGPDGAVWDAALLADGKILIAGDFANVSSTSRGSVARLTSSGALDTTFDPGSGANAIVHALAVQEDGKVIVAGDFTTMDGVARARIARLNDDGSLDTTFDPGDGANDAIYALAIQSDGKIFVGGTFTTMDGVARARIARLNSDGSLDTAFDPGDGANALVRALALQEDGKLLMGGTFSTVDGVNCGRIARLETDGALDASFDADPGFNGLVLAILIREDGVILAGGNFTTYDSLYRPRLARLKPDGSLDLNFDTGAGGGPNAGVYRLALQPGGKIIIGGEITTYDGEAAPGLARLNGATSIELETIYPDGEVGVPYSHDNYLAGYPLPTFWWITGGNLPDGLSLDAETGRISGTPTTAGSATFDLVGCNYTTLCGTVGGMMITIIPATTAILSVSLDGGGSGSVSSSPAGISCGNGGTDCAASFAIDEQVTLTASPAAGSTFSAWGGDCSGSSTICQVDMDAAKTVTATFELSSAGIITYIPLVTR